MSLDLTPTSNKYDRPLPPSRSKRSARTQDGASTPTMLDDEDLSRASRQEIEDGLKAKWIENEKLHERIDELEKREKGCQAEKEEMRRALGAMKDRYEEAFNEQARLEQDVEARDDLLDRLRSRLGMLERELRESQRIAQSQERSFESERTSLQAQETHLQVRNRQLQSQNQTSSSPSEILQEDLDSLRSSHSTLLNQVDRLSNEVQELRNENTRLKEENEGWEYLVREQTFSSRLFQREPDDGQRNQLDVLDEAMDEEMDDLNSELDAQTPSIDEPIFPRSTPTSRHPSGRVGRSISSTFSEESAEGMDLAAELGRAGVKDEIKPEVDEVKEENKRLREEVKALQLYCSKIIDRIIAQDGFEHILNVDYKTKRLGRSTSGNRGSLLDVVKMMQGDQPVKPVSPVAESTVRARPASMVRGNSGGVEPSTPVPVEDKAAKRARRGFSLDLRTFGFGSPPVEPKSALKPFQLTPSKPQPGRKLEPQAEDEDDRRERSRLEAALKLMGIDKSHPSSDASGVQTASRSSVKATGTPLSRLSSALGFSDSQLPADPDPTPESVDAALKDYDARERQKG